MCGLCGFIDIKHQLEVSQQAAVLTRMTDQISHRGPDDAGYWQDPEYGVGLGHRRLSILDLSPEGHQPMSSAEGRYVIAFNGEIYNYLEIREKLERQQVAPSWRGHSDTEIMLAAIAAWGLEEALKHFNGMFAFALWDRQEKTLSLARDRLGEKPLYYGWAGSVFLFGSELKSLRSHPAWRGEIDRGAVSLFSRLNYIPAPYSIYQNVYKLPPASYAVLACGDRTVKPVQPTEYWSAFDMAEYGSAHLSTSSDSEAIDELEALLSDSIRMRMVADVPLGAFLSGGVDSSVVVALMQKQSARPVKTFSIGFNEDAFNEAHYAGEVARHLKTEHTEFYVSAADALAVIPRLPRMYDEPFSDSSQIPTFLVSELAKRHVTVALSGDGGDELFGGYNRYFMGMKIWKTIGWLPASVRKGVANMMDSVPPSMWNGLFRTLGPVLPAAANVRLPDDKMKKLAEVLRVGNREQFYQRLLSHWMPQENLVIGGVEPPAFFSDKSKWPKVNDYAHHMMYQDLIGYLPGDILAKVDRASMAVSLEARVPLIDHRLVEFAWRLPTSQKIRGNESKWILRQVLYRHVPQAMIDRPKTGFGVPIGEWLVGPLRDWAENLLSESRLKQEGFFGDGVRTKWEEHVSGKQDWKYHLWDILMFQAWLDENK